MKPDQMPREKPPESIIQDAFERSVMGIGVGGDPADTAQFLVQRMQEFDSWDAFKESLEEMVKDHSLFEKEFDKLTDMHVRDLVEQYYESKKRK
ncbi:MAG: hypothetical protein V4486_02505 [Patescibacteria group bacterium]